MVRVNTAYAQAAKETIAMMGGAHPFIGKVYEGVFGTPGRPRSGATGGSTTSPGEARASVASASLRGGRPGMAGDFVDQYREAHSVDGWSSDDMTEGASDAGLSFFDEFLWDFRKNLLSSLQGIQ